MGSFNVVNGDNPYKTEYFNESDISNYLDEIDIEIEADIAVISKYNNGDIGITCRGIPTKFGGVNLSEIAIDDYTNNLVSFKIYVDGTIRIKEYRRAMFQFEDKHIFCIGQYKNNNIYTLYYDPENKPIEDIWNSLLTIGFNSIKYESIDVKFNTIGQSKEYAYYN